MTETNPIIEELNETASSVEAATQALDEARARRDAAIIAATKAGGITTVNIAKAAGVTTMTVSRVLNRA